MNHSRLIIISRNLRSNDFHRPDANIWQNKPMRLERWYWKSTRVPDTPQPNLLCNVNICWLSHLLRSPSQDHSERVMALVLARKHVLIVPIWHSKSYVSEDVAERVKWKGEDSPINASGMLRIAILTVIRYGIIPRCHLSSCKHYEIT